MQDAPGSHPATTPLLLPVVDAPTDAELVRSARAGDAFAFTRLWRRHEAAAATAASATPGRADVEQVVGAAASLIAQGIRSGGGPAGAARPYVLAAVREAAATADGRAAGAVEGDPSVLAPEEWYAESLPEGMRYGAAVAAAYSSLPVFAQEALWLAEVDGRTAAEIAAELGLSLPRAEGLLVEARTGIDSAWADAVAATVPAESECARILARRTQADRATERLRPKVRAHLETCATCRAAVGDASALARRLTTTLPILVLGGAAGTAFLEATRPGSSAAALAPVPPIDDRVAIAAGVGIGGAAPLAAHSREPPASAAAAAAFPAVSAPGAAPRTVRALPRRTLAAVATALGGVAAAAAIVAAVTLNGPLPTSMTSTPEAAGSADVAEQAPDMQPPVVVATELPPESGGVPDAGADVPPAADTEAPQPGADAGAGDATEGSAAPVAPAPSPSETPSDGDPGPIVSPGRPGGQDLVSAPGGQAPGAPIQAEIGKPGANGWRTMTLTGTPGAAYTVSDGGNVLYTGVLGSDGTAELAVRGSTANLSAEYGSLALTAGVDPANEQ